MRIVFLDEYSLAGADLAAIKALGEYTGYEYTTADKVVERAVEADVVITNKVVFTDEVMSQLPMLKLICVAATGMNNIDLAAAERRGIAVRNAVGYSTHSVAEATIGGAIALYREAVYYDEYVKSGRYSESLRPFNYARKTHSLYGQNWGIIGLGTIGREVAGLASALGCRVAYFSTSGVERAEKYPKMELEELLSWADIVSVHSPLNDRTLNLIDARRLAMMKRTAIIINVARGGIVNEAALADALNNDTIGGAVVDVFTAEPLGADNPLLGVKDKYKLLLSPHNAWSADKSIARLVECIAENIRDFERDSQ